MIIDCHNHVGADLMFYLHGDFPYAQHLVTMTSEGRVLGVNKWIVFPFVVPIVFLEGTTGRIFRELAVTVSVAVAVSALVESPLKSMSATVSLAAFRLASRAGTTMSRVRWARSRHCEE